MNNKGFASIIGMMILAFVILSLSYTTSKIHTLYVYNTLANDIDEHIYQEVKKQINNEEIKDIVEEEYQNCHIIYEYSDNEAIIKCSCFVESMHISYDLEKHQIIDVSYANY